MSSSDLRLRVEAREPSAELFALDRTFTIVASGTGFLEATLPRGLYKVRLQLGTTTKEAHIALDGEASRLIDRSADVSLSVRPDRVDVHFSETEFASPVPLRSTSRIHVSHFDNAARISAHTTRTLGSGSKLFIFSRAWSPPDEQGRCSGWDPMRDLVLHDANGRRLCWLSGSGERDMSGDPWAGCNLAVTPGSYRLRREGVTVLEMPLFVPEGWQLQVFLLASPNSRSEPPSIDFGRAAVLLSRRSFDHADPAWRLTEQARQGLSLRRSVMRDDYLRQMLFIKFDSPMLGIYDAHLLLTGADKPDVALLREIVRNLRRLLGPHPDVEAIALGSGMPVEHSHVFRWPPMLATSWELIVRASGVRSELVPTHSPAAWVAPRLWTSGGPWLMWSPIDDASVAKPDWLFREPLSPSEARVWQYWHAQAPARSGSRAYAKPTKAKVALDTVVNDLALPASVVVDAAWSLARRLATTEIPSNSFRDLYAARAITMMTKGQLGAVPSDEALVARIRQGEVYAFGSLVRRYERNVRTLVHGIVRDRDDTEEIVQEVFVRAYQALGTLQRELTPSTWLYKIARTVALEPTRRGSHAPKPPGRIPRPAPRSGPAGMAVRVPYQAFERALWELTLDQRVIFILSQMYELSAAEIAEIVGEPPRAVSRHLVSARSKLRHQLVAFDPTSQVSNSELRDLASDSLQRVANDRASDVSARVVATITRSRGSDDSRGSKVGDVEQAEDGASPVALDSPGRVVLQARHSTYPGPTPPWRPMHSRFSGRRVPEAENRKHSRAGFGRLIVESDLEEELYYEMVEEGFLELPPESTGDQVIYVALVSSNDQQMAGFASSYRGPYHAMGFASKIEDRSLLFTLVLDSNIACIRCPELQLSGAIDGVQYMTIPPIKATYEIDVEFVKDEE